MISTFAYTTLIFENLLMLDYYVNNIYLNGEKLQVYSADVLHLRLMKPSFVFEFTVYIATLRHLLCCS